MNCFLCVCCTCWLTKYIIFYNDADVPSTERTTTKKPRAAVPRKTLITFNNDFQWQYAYNNVYKFVVVCGTTCFDLHDFVGSPLPLGLIIFFSFFFKVMRVEKKHKENLKEIIYSKPISVIIMLRQSVFF